MPSSTNRHNCSGDEAPPGKPAGHPHDHHGVARFAHPPELSAIVVFPSLRQVGQLDDDHVSRHDAELLQPPGDRVSLTPQFRPGPVDPVTDRDGIRVPEHRIFNQCGQRMTAESRGGGRSDIEIGSRDCHWILQMRHDRFPSPWTSFSRAGTVSEPVVARRWLFDRWEMLNRVYRHVERSVRWNIQLTASTKVGHRAGDSRGGDDLNVREHPSPNSVRRRQCLAPSSHHQGRTWLWMLGPLTR